jgi:hypothetical protein
VRVTVFVAALVRVAQGSRSGPADVDVGIGVGVCCSISRQPL